MEHVRLNQAIADFALLTLENQEWMRGLVGSTDWWADVTTATLTLGQPFRMVVLGTHSEVTDTWLWSWANHSYAGLEQSPAIGPVLALRERADQLGMPELAVGEPFPVAGTNDMGWLPAAGIASVAGHLVGATSVYSGPYGGGRAWFGVFGPAAQSNPIKLPRFAVGAWDVARVSPTRDADGIRHRQALRLYGARRGLGVEERDDGTLRLVYPHGTTVDVEFDEHGREHHIKAEVTAGDVPDALPHEKSFEDDAATPSGS